MTVHAAADRATVEVRVGEGTSFVVDVTNGSTVIDAYTVEVYGIDTEWVRTEPARLPLFPGERGRMTVTVTLPSNHPATDRTVAINVRSENDPGDFALADVRLHVAPRRGVTVAVDPSMMTGGRRGSFGMLVRNTGNVDAEIAPMGLDPEALAVFDVLPPSATIGPDDTMVFRVTVSGGRDWFGQIRPRQLTLGVSGEPPTVTTVVFLQRPRIPRWLLSLIGFLLAALVFALVLDQAFGGVVDKAKFDSRVVEQALKNQLPGGATIAVRPARIVGALTSTTSNPDVITGVAGIQVNAFTKADPLHPVGSAVTDVNGAYEIGGLKKGPYLLRFSGAGFDPVWYPGSADAADAVEVQATDSASTDSASTPTPPKMRLGGQPGSVSGSVTGGNPVGATATLVVDRQPAVVNPPVMAVTKVSADGTFSFPSVPAPAAYVLIIEQADSATERRKIHLDAAQVLDSIEVTLRPGDGQISGLISVPREENGRVVQDGTTTLLGGAVVTATDGTNVVRSVSLTDGADLGTFTLRNLAVPGRYTVTVEAEGYAAATGSIVIDELNQQRAFDVTLVPSEGAIVGAVELDDLGLSGGITVSVVGPDFELSTTSVSTAEQLGQFVVSPVPVPGVYTVTVSRPGYLPQVLQIELNAQQLTGTVATSLTTATGTIRGTVDQVDLGLVGHADVLITDGTVEYHVSTADDPLGEFEVANLPPGSYTVRAHLIGTTDAVWVVDLSPAEVSRVDLHLGIQATISGRVVRTNSDGTTVAVAGAQVRLIPIADFPTTDADATTMCTNANGEFSFTALDGGQTFVVAVYESSAVATGGALDSQQVTSFNGAKVFVPRSLVVKESAVTC